MRYSSILAVTFTALVMINGSDSQKTIDQMLQDLKEAGKEKNPCDKLKVSPVLVNTMYIYPYLVVRDLSLEVLTFFKFSLRIVYCSPFIAY